MSGARESNKCDLCGLPCGRHPLVRRFAAGERAFCCSGCLNVYTILLESGVMEGGRNFRETELFRQSLKLGLISNPARSPEKAPAPPGVESREALFQISGMWCSSCAWLIEHALASERGVLSAEVSFTSDLLKVTYCPQFVPPGRIVRRIAELGYQASEYTGQEEQDGAERKDLLLRMGVAAFFWMNVMTLSMVLYVGYFEQIAESVRRALPFVLMGLTTPVVFYSAWPVLRVAYRGLLHGTVRMETLLGLGVIAAYSYSAAQAARGETHVYFDTVCAIVTLVLAGKLAERSAKEKTARAITLLYRMMPKKARLIEDGCERFVSVEALEAGAVFLVKPGERIPADGVVVEGHSHVDESVLTGESAPVAKNPGSAVACGSVNAGGSLQVRVTKAGAESTLAQIVRAVEAALASRSSVERMADRISRVFVPAVILLAIATFAGWTAAGAGIGTALMRAITVLVIACPCALGIATPLALTAAIGAASRKGILVSHSRVLETIRKVDVVILDKTGTVTEGRVAMLEVAVRPALVAAGGAAVAESECLSLLASLESHSEHPLARAVMRRAEEEGIRFPAPRQVNVHKGMGIVGWVAGRRAFIGNRRLALGEGARLDDALEREAGAWEGEGRTVAFFGRDGEVTGALSFGDRIKDTAPAAVAELKRRGIRTMLVSGDACATTRWVAARIGADDFQAEVLPEDKTRIVRRLREQGRVVAMIGDGVNDAAALAEADLGIALGSGADVAMKAAPVVLMTGALTRVLDVFDLADATLRVVRQNLFWAFLYNGAGISLAVAGILNPILAAAAMVVSSLSVIGNSLRLASRIRAKA